MTGAANTPLRIGLIGSGMVARAHVSAFRAFPERVQLVAVCDVRRDAAQAVADMAGEPAVFTDFEELLETATIDAVDICTPHHLHAAQAIAAARTGKHVLVEKPMACSVEEACAMVDAADAAGVTLMVGQSLRYVPANAGVRAAIASGLIGDVWAARGDDWFPSPPPSAWMRDAKLAGGGVLHMGGTHRVDLFRYYLGEIASVRARTWTDHPDLANGSEDRVLATLEFESGAIAQLSACWAGYEPPHFFAYTILGTAGAVESIVEERSRDLRERMLAEHHAPALSISTTHPVRVRDSYLPIPPVNDGLVGEDPFVNEIVHFADSIRDGIEPLSSGRDNIGTMKAIYGCYESARTGRDVALADV